MRLLAPAAEGSAGWGGGCGVSFPEQNTHTPPPRERSTIQPFGAWCTHGLSQQSTVITILFSMVPVVHVNGRTVQTHGFGRTCMQRIGKLASVLAVTATPQKNINIRLPVGGPCFVLGGLSRPSWFFLSSFSSGRWASCLEQYHGYLVSCGALGD